MIDDPLGPFRPDCGIPAQGAIVLEKMEALWPSNGQALLIIEAIDSVAARQHYQALLAQGDFARLTHLSRGLLYSQAQASGRYWRFTLEGTTE